MWWKNLQWTGARTKECRLYGGPLDGLDTTCREKDSFIKVLSPITERTLVYQLISRFHPSGQEIFTFEYRGYDK